MHKTKKLKPSSGEITNPKRNTQMIQDTRGQATGSQNTGHVYTIQIPVMANFADHLEVPSSTLCLTAFIWPVWDFLSTPNTFL